MNPVTKSPSTESLSIEEERRVATAIELSEEYRELDYLRYFYDECDFGPAHEDVVAIIRDGYPGKIPKGYEEE